MTVPSVITRTSPLPWGGIRLTAVIIGGLLVLQSSEELDAPKLAYLLGTLGCIGVAVARLVRSRDSASVREWREVLIVDAALLVLLALSFAVARANGVHPIDWLRDAVAYGLFVFVPVLAWDAGTTTPPRLLTGVLVLAGLLATVSWGVQWLDSRGIADIPIDRVVLPAGRLATALYVFALVAAASHREPVVRWSLTAGLVLGIFLATGSRSSLLLVAVPLLILFLVRSQPLAHRARAIGIHLAVAVVVFVLVAGLAPAIRATPEPTDVPTPAGTQGLGGATGRLGSLIENPAGDPSLKERVAQYAAAWSLFASSPLVGVGPGHAIEWIDVSGFDRSAATADTPLVLPAKFGMLGVVVVALMVLAYFRYVVGTVTRLGWVTPNVALVSYLVVLILGLPLGMPLEDKAFSFATALLAAILVAAQHTRASEAPSNGAYT